MALIQCKHCGQKISDKAEKCPKCGEISVPVSSIKTIYNNNETSKGSIRNYVACSFIALAVISIVLSYLCSIRELNCYSLSGVSGSDLGFGCLFIAIAVIFLFLPIVITKTRSIKWASAGLLIFYIIGFCGLKYYYYQLQIVPAIDFEKAYCNSNILSVLNGQEFETYDCNLEISDNTIHLSTPDGMFDFTIPIMKVYDGGTVISDVISTKDLGMVYIQISPFAGYRWSDLFSGPKVPLDCYLQVNLNCTNSYLWDRSFYHDDNFGVCKSWTFYGI